MAHEISVLGRYTEHMKLQQVSESCFAVLCEKNRACDANSGLINLGGGVVIDTQPDLPHGRQMIRLFGKVWPDMPKRVINTHEDADHVWGNQLFEGAEIIAHRKAAERMPHVADPKETQQLLKAANGLLSSLLLKMLHPGAMAIANRPDKIRVTRTGGFADVEMSFEGNTLTLLGKNYNLYTQLDVPGTIDHLIDELRGTYQRPLPAADLLLTNSYDGLMLDVVDAKDLGTGVIGGVLCDHLVFRKDQVDFQIWIAQGKRPYPR